MSGRDDERAPGPVKVPGREDLRPKLSKRIYQKVTFQPAAQPAAQTAAGGGFEVRLDDRQAKTPGKRPLVVPTKALAATLLQEWDVQLKEIDPESMPLTRLANTVIDGVVGNEQAVRDDIVAFSGSDLLCYRAEAPQELADAQAQSWGPVLNWVQEAFGVSFVLAQGVMPVVQSERATRRIAEELAKHDAWTLTALHLMTTLTGSALLALAHASGRLSAEEAWAAAHVDEDWQIRMWGDDREASERRARRWRDMQAASRLYALVSTP